jgi:hypothetical protein
MRKIRRLIHFRRLALAKAGEGMDGTSEEEDPSESAAGNAEISHVANGGGSDPLRSGIRALCDQLLHSTSVDGAAVAILTGSRHVRELLYASDTVARQLDELQFTLGEGPCLDAFFQNWPQLWAHLDTTITVDALWPGFAVEALHLGAQAVFAFPVPDHSGPLGVLEIYRNTPGGLRPGEAERATDIAAAIGDTLQRNLTTHHAANPDTAIETIDAIHWAATTGVDPYTRAAVHIAAGITAIQLNTSPDDGLDLIRAYAYAQQRSTTTVAADIIGRRLSLRDHHGRPPHL